jgi:hypothetical protein
MTDKETRLEMASSTMTLRSGKTLTPVNNLIIKKKIANDSLVKAKPCFGTDGWPSLEEARAKSIATDETYEFHAFCRNELFKVENSDAYAKRLCTLTVTESLMRSGPRILKMHQPSLEVLYHKLKDAFSVTPPDMREYLDRLRSFQYSSVSPCVE